MAISRIDHRARSVLCVVASSLAASCSSPTMTLQAAIDEGRISPSFAVRSLNEIGMKFGCTSARTFTLRIPPGMIVKGSELHAGGMLLLPMTTVVNYRACPDGQIVGAAALSTNTPDYPPGTALILSKTEAGADVKALTTLPAFRSASPRVRQFAIWTIVDDPKRDAYPGLVTNPSAWVPRLPGVPGSGPLDAEIQEIRRLLTAVKLDPDRYQLFSPR